MMATLLGKEKYRKGTDEYFHRHDGQAVTVEDWVSALSAGSGVGFYLTSSHGITNLVHQS